ncbi:MAG: hypothetical protein ACXABY_15935 [Candidatus Thorarchaeota archaeon]
MCRVCKRLPVKNHFRRLCTRCASYIYYHASRLLSNSKHFDLYESKQRLAAMRVRALRGEIVDHRNFRRADAKKRKRNAA